MAEKNMYEKPDLDTVIWESENIITVSGTDGDENQGEWDPLTSSPWSIVS